MEKDVNDEIDDLRKLMTKDVQQNNECQLTGGLKPEANFKPGRKYLVLGAIGFIVLIVLYLSFNDSNAISTEDFNSVSVKLGEIDKRVTKLEKINEKISLLENQVQKLEHSISIEYIPVASKPSSLRYHEVRPNDTLSQIAQKYGITVDDLCRLNKITPKTLIRPGQKLLISS